MRSTAEPLDERAREMLTLLIKIHIATGEPVGSRTIARHSSENLSPATVRNIIADLEEAGFVEQPHTSAGRVPTDQGYRLYVDQLLEQTRLSASDLKEIHRGMFGDQAPSAEQLLSRASHLLSDMSESVGIVISPRPSQERIKHLEFVRLSDGRILVITVSRSGFVQDRLIRIDVDFTQDELDRTARYVNANFSGMSLRAIRGELLRRMSEEKALYDRLLQNAILLCERSFSESGDASPEVFVEGTSNILIRSDLADTERMRELFRIFEEKSKLVRLLDECVTQTPSSPIGVRIGAENGLPGLRGYAVISSSYHDGDQIVGSLGILGPVRMEYARTIGVVNYIARLLEQALDDSPSPANN